MIRLNPVHDLVSLFAHDLFGKPVSTFPDRALVVLVIVLQVAQTRTLLVIHRCRFGGSPLLSGGWERSECRFAMVAGVRIDDDQTIQ